MHVIAPKYLNIIFLIIFSVSLFSCGKDKKPEFVDDKTDSKTNDTKTEQLNNSENSVDDNSVQKNDTTNNNTDNSNQKNPNSKYKDFENEKPVAVISPLEANDYNGKTVTVKGFVADVYQSEKVAYLNFVEKFPNNPFTAVIFASKFSDFPDIIKYKNKDIEVTGRVSMFKGKPQIICNSPKQIVIK